MYKNLLLILSILAISFSQTTIPAPNEIANFTKKTFPDDSVYKDQYLEATASSPIVSSSQNIGDFDGDNSDEIYITWARYLTRHRVKISDNSILNYDDPFHQSCVFSTKKNSYLIIGPFATNINSFYPWPTTVVTGDFTGDGNIDFLIGDKIYSTSTPIVKKNK
jgi:hypothetical protein